MESMTGYAFIEKNTQQFSFSIELKSLNSKYLESYINLPRILRNDENEFDSMLKNRFGRGKLELSIELYDWSETRPVSINRELLKKYYSEVVAVTKSLKIENSFSIDALLTLDGVIQKEKSILSEKSRADIMAALNMVIDRTIKMRRREGSATAKDLRACLAVIAKRLAGIEALSKDVSQALFARLKKSVESLANARVDDVRLYTEIAILADKQDINEEIVRLKDHMKKFRQVMDEEGQVGKQLDFLAQEMFREINTISSKSNNSEISHLAVDIKNNIDKIREQCRNII